jgi:hypothetical protein
MLTARRYWYLVCCLFLAAHVGLAQQPPSATAETNGKATFVPACTAPSYPTPPPVEKPAIDGVCGLEGAGREEANQNAAKNNFCAQGTATEMTIEDFTKLQAQVDNNSSIPYGDSAEGERPKGPAVDRAPLRALGEGKLARIQAYVLFGRQEGPESVNCEKAVPDEPAYHDIHIELVSASGTTDECSGIVAEMSAHHRPTSWTADKVEQVAGAELPVRVTGQLFFDSSHFRCRNGASVGDNQKRISLWEIHPIYQFDVCASGECSGNTGWVRSTSG